MALLLLLQLLLLLLKLLQRTGVVSIAVFCLIAAGRVTEAAARHVGTDPIDPTAFTDAAASTDQCKEQDSCGSGIGSDVTADESVNCRAALAFSGHVRSFSHPKVHQSVLRYLIEPIEVGGCQVDVFMYLTMEDEVPQARLDTDHWNKFEPYTPKMDDVIPAIALLDPKAVQWHQEQAGIIPNSCRDGQMHVTDPVISSAVSAAYWQLYKNLAVFRMVEKYERQHGFSYDWVVRSRLDLGWLSPIAPLNSFPADRAFFGSSFWPLSDQFALLPRKLAEGYMSAIRTFYKCPTTPLTRSAQPEVATPWWWESQGGSATEALLWEHIHSPDAVAFSDSHDGQPDNDDVSAPAPSEQTRVKGPLPYQYYDFHYVIVRYKEGGKCATYLPYKLPMQLMSSYGRLYGGKTLVAVLEPVHLYFRKECEKIFSGPLDSDDGGGGRGEGVTSSPTSSQVESELMELRVRVLKSIAAINVTMATPPPPSEEQRQKRTLKVVTSVGLGSDSSVVGQVAMAFILTEEHLVELGRSLRCELWNIVYGHHTGITAGECSGEGARNTQEVWTDLWRYSKDVGTCRGPTCEISQLNIPTEWLRFA